MKFDKIHKALNEIAPEELQEKWDNSGTQICTNYNKEISNIMTCLEINDKVVKEAILRDVDLIVTHHPLIFTKISKVDSKTVTGNQLISLINHDISVYSSHTSFDSAKNGTNQYLAELIGIENIIPMLPSELNGCGMGRYGEFKKPWSLDKLLEKLNQVCGKMDIRVAGVMPDKISKLALCTGAGADFIELASEENCDVFITGDVKYHDARLAYDLGLCVIDAGHYGTEVIFAENMAMQLHNLLPTGIKIMISESNIYPFLDLDSYK